MDKICLNWNGYNANISESFRKLRENQILSDVTLVTDDGQHIQAHKIVLSAGSKFFSDIFMKSNLGSSMLVYLKGISGGKLEPIIDFIYNGKVFITQEQLKGFIETGKELQVKGLENELAEIAGTIAEIPMNTQESGYSYDSHEEENTLTVSDADDDDYAIEVNGVDLQLEPSTKAEYGKYNMQSL